MLSPAKSSSLQDAEPTVASSPGANASYSGKKTAQAQQKKSSKEPQQISSKSPRKSRDRNKLPPGEEGWEVESDDEVEAEEKRDSWFRMNEKQRKEHELRARMTQKVAYYEQGGVKLPVVQNRLPNASRKPGLWMNPYEGEYKIAFDGQRFQKYGFMVRGKRSQHNYFEIKLKVDGEKKRALRAKVQRLLQKSIRNPDLIDVKRVALLVKFGREIKGSLVMLDCTRAEQALLRYRRRVEAAVAVQRGHQSRSWAASIGYERRRSSSGVPRSRMRLTARKLVTGFLRDSALAARNRVVERVLDNHRDARRVVCCASLRSGHHDWKHLKRTAQRAFRACSGDLRPAGIWHSRRWWLSMDHAVVKQSFRQKGFHPSYSPMQSVVYSLAVTEADMKRRMLLDQYRRLQGSVALPCHEASP